VEYIGDFTTNVKDENRTEPRSWRERLLAMMIQTVALIIGLAAIAGFAIYLIGIAWLCFSETRQGSATPNALDAFGAGTTGAS